MSRVKKVFAVLCSSVMLAGVAASPAAAQAQTGLVNVAIGDVNVLNDANVGVAAQVAANICGVNVGPVAVLANQVARGSADKTVCTTDQGPVTISRGGNRGPQA